MKKVFMLFVSDIDFLSHLSGDEGFSEPLLNMATFLSHLSGDEASRVLTYSCLIFLSHLSGDEESASLP